MQTNIEKIKSSKSLTKNLMLSEIVKAENEILKMDETMFTKSLQIAAFVTKSNEFFVSTECKDEFKKLNVKYKNFTEYVTDLIKRDKRQSQRYIQLGKLDSETIAEFKDSEIGQSMQNCIKFANDKKQGKTNLTATAPVIDKSKVVKPKKYATKNKGIEILLHEVTLPSLRDADIIEAIKYLKNMIPKKVAVKKAA